MDSFGNIFNSYQMYGRVQTEEGLLHSCWEYSLSWLSHGIQKTRDWRTNSHVGKVRMLKDRRGLPIPNSRSSTLVIFNSSGFNSFCALGFLESGIPLDLWVCPKRLGPGVRKLMISFVLMMISWGIISSMLVKPLPFMKWGITSYVGYSRLPV